MDLFSDYRVSRPLLPQHREELLQARLMNAEASFAIEPLASVALIEFGRDLSRALLLAAAGAGPGGPAVYPLKF